jgi:hypothetical protein
MRKMRRILSVAYGKIKNKFVRQLISVMKEIAEKNKEEQDDLYQKYLEHCTVFIQKTWRGYWSR